MRKALELAERLGGMTAFELMDRMTMEEINLWVEYDNMNVSKSDYQFAVIAAKLDWIKGVKRPDPRIYLPGVKRKRKTLAELKAHFDAAVGNSGRLKHG